MTMLHQSPTDPDFVQNPYPFYRTAPAPVCTWAEYDMPAAFTYDAANAILRDRRFGREVPADLRAPVPDHLAPFYAVEDHSMLELDGDVHRRLRGLVLRAFTSRRIAGLAPEIAQLCHDLIDAFPEGDFDLIPAYATQVPVIVIARLLGVPEDMAPQLLRWSNDMVAMYQARRTREIEDRAARAAAEFAAFVNDYADQRRDAPGDDLISSLLAAEEDGARLSREELVTTCILLLNAGHEATVHTIGNGVKALLGLPDPAHWLTEDRVDGTVEEILRHDPPLHMFTRIAHQDVEVQGHRFQRGDSIACLLGAANRDPARWEDPDRFDPGRPVQANLAFGAGAHFCIGAPLARLELRVALPVLLQRCPGLTLAEPPRYADLYHFHGLERLMVHC
ncbi:cytochrome P450 [Pseudooceanicola aestuarii]|uniref:cytochrome P450 n=1 Tax=Pseudooceanicola aestuarii TaxID=2697319 RepID=UPI0013D5BFE2|nr:cytochrome P450 [Pseudooceanicola aestuarii]